MIKEILIYLSVIILLGFVTFCIARMIFALFEAGGALNIWHQWKFLPYLREKEYHNIAKALGGCDFCFFFWISFAVSLPFFISATILFKNILFTNWCVLPALLNVIFALPSISSIINLIFKNGTNHNKR